MNGDVPSTAQQYETLRNDVEIAWNTERMP